MKIKSVFAGVLVALLAVSAAFAQSEEFDPSGLESSGYSENLGFGFYGTVPSVKYNFTGDFSGQAGLGISKVAPSGLSNNSTTFLVQAETIFMRIGDVNLKYGGFVSMLHDSSSSAVLAGTLGVEKRFSPNLNLSFDIIPVSMSSGGSSSSTVFGLLSGTVISAHFYF